MEGEGRGREGGEERRWEWGREGEGLGIKAWIRDN